MREAGLLSGKRLWLNWRRLLRLGRVLPVLATLSDSFLVVRREYEAAFRTYRTCDMTLVYMNVLAVEDTETRVAI